MARAETLKVEYEMVPKGAQSRKDESEDSSSDESELASRPDSRMSSEEDLTKTNAVKKKIESLKERGKIPSSFYLTVFCIVMLQGCSGMYKLETLESWWSSVVTSTRTINEYLEYERDLMKSAFYGEATRDTKEYIKATIVTAIAASLFGIFIYAPFRAGMWTGQRATRHKVHRYMGLFFLIQYAWVWVEFLSNYAGADDLSFLPHSLALNGGCSNKYR